MEGFRHILVCLDRSSQSDLCLSHALALAKTFGSNVTLLHVMQPPDDCAGPQTTDALKWEVARQEAGADLERFEKSARLTAQLHIETHLEQGRPADRIVALARKLGADLVVLGGHGTGGTAYSLGSTALRVLGAATSSVFIARAAAPSATFIPPQRIMIPLDGSPRTESVLPTALGIGKSNGAELLLVHVVTEPHATGILVLPEDLALARDLATRLQAQAAKYLHTVVDKLGQQDLPVRTLVARQADKRQYLIELCATEKIDLLVVLAHGSTCNVARPFGSVAAHLLTHSTIALLVLQDLPRSKVSKEDRAAPKPRASCPPETP